MSETEYEISAYTWKYATEILTYYLCGVMDIGWGWTPDACFDCSLLNAKEKDDLWALLNFNGLQVGFYKGPEGQAENYLVIRGRSFFAEDFNDNPATKHIISREMQATIDRNAGVYNAMKQNKFSIENLAFKIRRNLNKKIKMLEEAGITDPYTYLDDSDIDD